MPWIRLYSSNTEAHFLAQYCCAKKEACVLFLIARSRCKVSLGVHRSCRNDGKASRPVMKTFPVREGDYLHYRPECIFSTYLARRWEFAIGSFSLWWKHFLHETGTVFITGWKSSLRCSWERDPWSRKQAGCHPPRDEKNGSCSHRPARCEQVRFSSRGGGISCAQLLQKWGMIWAAWCFTRVSAPFECGFGSFTFQQNSSSSPCDRQLDSVEI